jgi:hypothetical protein
MLLLQIKLVEMLFQSMIISSSEAWAGGETGTL